MYYHFFHLRDRSESGSVRLLQQLQRMTEEANGVTVWGVFAGLFGLATNEVYWLVMAESSDAPDIPAFGADIEIVQQTTLRPTVRPTSHEPRSKQGVYVFRWFEVNDRHVEEVVRLSGEAWQTFEDGFDTEVQGLFTATPPPTLGEVQYRMLLITWYQDLAVWQQSRAPDPEARKRFMARQALLGSALPIATRLESGL